MNNHVRNTNGPKPKPNLMKKLEGSKYANDNELPLEPKAPEPPKHLENLAYQEWQRIVPILENTGMLTDMDMAMLAAYCTVYARWVECETFLEKYGTIERKMDSKGNQVHKARPEAQLADKYLSQLKSLCSEFGMSPSSRGKMSLPSEKESKDEFEGLVD